MTVPTFVIIIAGVISTLVLFFLVWIAYRTFLRYQQWRKEERRATLHEDIRSIQIAQWNDDLTCKDNCSLCMQTFNYREDVAMLPCEHGFHFRCIEEQIRHAKLTCPFCTAEIVPNSNRYRAGDYEDDPDPDQQNEGVPLLRQTLLQRLRAGNNRRLSVPSDLDEDACTPNRPSTSRSLPIGAPPPAPPLTFHTSSHRQSNPSLSTI